MLLCHYFLNTALSIPLEDVGLRRRTQAYCQFVPLLMFSSAMRSFGLNISCRYLKI